MLRLLRHTTAVLQLTRIALVFTAIADIWLIALLSRGYPQAEPAIPAVHSLPLPLLLLTTAAVATGMYGFGMALNDIIDTRRDRLLTPSRPIPAGQIGFGPAIAVAILSLLVALAASVPLGPTSTLLALLTAALIVFYNTAGKSLPAAGILALGLIRAGHMLVANPALDYAWPVWLTFTHVLGISAAAHRLEGKRPLLRGWQIWTLVGGWAFATVALLGWIALGSPPALHSDQWLGLAPLIAVGLFIILALRTIGTADHMKQAGGLLIKRGLLWLIVYDTAWLAGAHLWWQALLVAALLPLAYLTMIAMRHLNAAVAEEPAFLRE